MSNRVRRLLAALLLGSLLPPAAGAVGLGELRVVSALGERFRAEIPVLNPTPAISGSCFHSTTDTPEAVGEAPWLADMHVAYRQDPPRLVISSRRQVFDPLVQVAIYTGCGTYLTRHYVALLSPPKEPVATPPVVAQPVYERLSPYTVAGNTVEPVRRPAGRKTVSARKALPGESARDMARRLYPHSRGEQRNFVKQLAALNPGLLSASGDEVLPDDVDLQYPPPARRPKAMPSAAPAPVAAKEAKQKGQNAESGDRLVLSASEPAQSDLAAQPPSSAELGKRVSDVERQIKSMRDQLNSVRADYPTPPPAVQTLLAEMETRLLAVELSVARINLANLASETPVSGQPSTPAVSTAGTPGSDTAVAAASPPAAPAPVLPEATASRAPEQSEAAPPPEIDLGFALLGVCGIGFGLSMVLYRRTKQKRNERQAAVLIESLGVEPPRRLKKSPTPVATPAVKAANADAAEGEKQKEKPLPLRVSNDPEDLEQPVELANIMVIYGQIQSAVDVLRNFVEAHPRESLRASLRLLELYKDGGMRSEFEALAGQLTSRFNVARPDWDDMTVSQERAEIVVDEQLQQGPASLIAALPQHLQAEVAARWGRQECVEFLRSLTSDNRGGTRRGFPVATVQAIVRLIRMLERGVE